MLAMHELDSGTDQNSGDVLQVRGLTVGIHYSDHERTLLDDISFNLKARSVLGIMGESGSGKTVLSRALVNWLPAPLAITGGEVIYNGIDLLALPHSSMGGLRGTEIAYIGADPGSAMDPTLPVGKQIMEKLRAVEPGVSKREAQRRVIELLDAVRIPQAEQRFHEYPFQFSGGMMQRALIVDALITNPKLLVADNITQPLDVTVAAQILRLLRGLQDEFETAVIFISSSLGVISEIADDVLMLARGKIIEHAHVQQLLQHPEHEYTRRLLERAPHIWSAQAQLPPAVSTDDITLEVEDVSKIYEVPDPNKVFARRRVQAVRGTSFSVRRGESFGIIGESGCGKSTLSRLLSYLEPTDTGDIIFDGSNVTHLTGERLLHLRRRFQLLLQDPYNAIPSHKEIGWIIGEPLRIHRLSSGRALQEKVRAVMREVGLDESLYYRLPTGLSAGQRQRVNMARALVLEPELLILDETLSSLDQVEQARFIELFERLQKERGITYIYISHDLALVRRVCQRIGVMYLGRIVELAHNEDIFTDPAHPYTRALLSAAPTTEHNPFPMATYLLDGEPPDPVDIGPGCTFRTRCPFAIDRCYTDDPKLRPVETEQAARHYPPNQVACFLSPGAMPEPDFSSQQEKLIKDIKNTGP